MREVLLSGILLAFASQSLAHQELNLECRTNDKKFRAEIYIDKANLIGSLQLFGDRTSPYQEFVCPDVVVFPNHYRLLCGDNRDTRVVLNRKYSGLSIFLPEDDLKRASTKWEIAECQTLTAGDGYLEW